MNARMEKFNFVCLQLVKYLSTPVVERWISQLQTLPGEKQVDRYWPNFFAFSFPQRKGINEKENRGKQTFCQEDVLSGPT